MKNTRRLVDYVKHLLTLASSFTDCISISTFASAIGIPVEITSSAVGLKIGVIAAGIKKYK